MINDATARQVKSANPATSTWLSANAGSGKTRVLTDRVARLLLSGVRPENILCLTYTKAAASEMQNRLFQRLGRWTMLDEATLRTELAELGVDPADVPHDLQRPRTLFATAIEAPGGLKIQTIHSFCSALLRRFPLEAQVSPQFREMEDREQRMLVRTILDQMADGSGPSPFDAVAFEMPTGSVEDLLLSVIGTPDLFQTVRTQDEIWSSLGLSPGKSEDDILQDVFLPGDHALLAQLQSDIAFDPDEKTNGPKMAVVPLTMDRATFDALVPLMLVKSEKDGQAYRSKAGAFPKVATRKKLAYCDALDALIDRIALGHQMMLHLTVAKRTHALESFAVPFLDAYRAEKARIGVLDFNDLITKTNALLQDRYVADWVLYKLDGGIDHILVDEAQDTSPDQWKVIESLTQEMTSGLGGRDVDRTIFVVGDKKQSIYSFQGADPAGFDRMRDHFEQKLKTIEQPFQKEELAHSFRSSCAILRVVDKVFEGQTGLGQASDHIAFKSSLPGRVDAWAFVEAQSSTEETNWTDPVDLKADDHHDKILANAIASEIKKLLKTGTLPDIRDGAVHMRKIEPRDILILVRSRQAGLFSELHRACKSAELPVSGYDRLTVTEELAVKDILALLSFLATPEDDYALACALRSPLFGWSEDDLYELTAHRGGAFVWAALRDRADDWPETVSNLQDLRKRADFMRPYDLLEYILTDLKGRHRLIGRLGREAEESIDALSALALDFEQVQVPSLTQFLVWLEQGDIEIKRQLDGRHNEIRIMTIHGSKGLEAPIVILPQTNRQNAPRQTQIVDEDGLLWLPKRDDLPNSLRKRDSRDTAKSLEERDRLLYVALTRAEKWLIVAGSGKTAKDDDKNQYWYKSVWNALAQCGAEPFDSPTGPGLRFEPLKWTGLIDMRDDHTATKPAVHTISQDPLPKPAAATKPLNPSTLPGPKTVPGDMDGSPDALEYGIAVHAYLEHLPEIPRNDWQSVTEFGGDAARAEAVSILNHPDLAWLFGPGSAAEVPVVGEYAPGKSISGVIDRLVMQDDHVWIVDYKTNRVVPDDAKDIPAGLVSQMHAYVSAIRPVFPDHTIKPAILWTKTATMMLVETPDREGDDI